mgnify:CR=1 FL=1
MTKHFGNPVVAELDEPGVSKDSRENLHDTSNAVPTGMANAKHEAYQRLVVDLEEVFGAAIEPYIIMSDHRLTGRDIHNAVMEALDSCKGWRKSELSLLEDFESYASGSRPVYLD